MLFSWSALAFAFPSAALLNQTIGDRLDKLGISATGLLLAFFALCLTLALTATTEQASRANRLLENAVLDATLALDAARFEMFVGGLGPDQKNGLIVIPALNEEATIGAVVAAANLKLCWPVIVIDDGSTDATSDAAAGAGAFVSRISCNVGVGGAVRLGLRFADLGSFQRVLQLDADGQHPPSEASHLLSYVSTNGLEREDCLVIGSRFAGGTYEMGRVRRLAIKWMSRRVKKRSGIVVTDPSSGFRLFSGKLIVRYASQHLPTEYLGDTFGFLLLACSRFRVVEQKVTMLARQGGSASSRGLDNVKFLLRALLRS